MSMIGDTFEERKKRGAPLVKGKVEIFEENTTDLDNSPAV